MKPAAGQIAALDVSIELIHPEIGGARLSPVNAWQGRYEARGALRAFLLKKVREASSRAGQSTYGGYGNLRAWVLATLEAVCPQALDTSALVDAAEAAFALKFSTPTARARFRDNSLAKALRVAWAANEVERVDAGPVFKGPGVWRWRPWGQALVELQAAIQDAAG